MTLPLVEKTLRFLQTRALSPPSEATLLRAGALRVCGKDLSRPGCKIKGLPVPSADATGPDASRAWRETLESAMAAESISQGESFDKTVFQRFVIDAMVDALSDPASFYMAPGVYKAINHISSDFVGFGLRVTPQLKALEVVAVHMGSPAESAGVMRGDRIVRVNGEGVTGYRRPLALAAIWGAEGEEISLSVARGAGVKKISLAYKDWAFDSFTVVRDGAVVVAKVRHFDTGLAAMVRKELTMGCAGLVIDLRDAAGGADSEMVQLADILLSDDPIGARQMRGKLGSSSWVGVAKSAGENTAIPVAVVTNRGSTGLTEVLAAAVRSANRGILVGTGTAGLDTLETVGSLGDGSAVQVTSTRLVGPDALSLAEGVLPHMKTRRSNVVDLAVEIVNTTSGPDVEHLLEAAKKSIGQ